MSAPKFRIGKYAIELFILIAGIMISFLLNEWRVSNQERKEKNRLVNQFMVDLASDTTRINELEDFIETVSASCNELLVLDSLSDLAKTSNNVAAMMNTVSQSFNDATYIEASTSGKLGLIESDELRSKLIKMYNKTHEEIYNWHAIDMNETLPNMMQYYNAHFPYAEQLDFRTLPKNKLEELETALIADEFKNLVQLNLIIKNGILNNYRTKMQETHLLFELLKEEMKQ